MTLLPLAPEDLPTLPDLDGPASCPASLREVTTRALGMRLARLIDEMAACERVAREELGYPVLTSRLRDARERFTAAIADIAARPR